MKIIDGVRYRPEDAPRHAAPIPAAAEPITQPEPAPAPAPVPVPESEANGVGVVTADEKTTAKSAARKKEA